MIWFTGKILWNCLIYLHKYFSMVRSMCSQWFELWQLQQCNGQDDRVGTGLPAGWRRSGGLVSMSFNVTRIVFCVTSPRVTSSHVTHVRSHAPTPIRNGKERLGYLLLVIVKWIAQINCPCPSHRHCCAGSGAGASFILKYSIAFVLYYFDLSTLWVMKLIYMNIWKVDIWPFLSVRMDSNAPNSSTRPMDSRKRWRHIA